MMIGVLILAAVGSANGPATANTALSRSAFIENKGQWNSSARFLMKSPGANLWVTDSGAVIDYYKHTSKTVQIDEDITGKKISTKGDVVRVNFVGASSSVVPVGVSKKKSKTNFIVGGNEFNGVASFNEAKLVNVLPGVTARYYVDGGLPRYDVILSAGAKPESVKLSYEGAKNLRVGADGSLQYDISLGTVREQNLFVYQMVDGVKREVSAKFNIKNGQVGFNLGSYDATKPVVIDPQIFLAGTFLGGTGVDEVGAVSVSPSGSFVVAGLTAATDFPTTVGAYDSDSTNADWFISHLRSDLTDVDVFSTYVSGTATEVGWSTSTQGMKVRVLDNQDIVFAANTNSTDLPATGGVQTGNIGSIDGYVLRLRANGGERMFSTYIGGAFNYFIWDMDVNPANGEVALAIQTGSADLSSTVSNRGPLTKGASADTTKSGSSDDAFVLMLDKRLSSVKMGSFFGGASTEAGKAVNFGKGYNTLVLGGQTQSTTDLTFTTGAPGGRGRDLFLARFALQTAAVQFSVAFGSNIGADTFSAMEMDMVNDRPYFTALITGSLYTSQTTLPVKYGFDSSSNGGSDVLVGMFSQDLNQAIMSFYGATGTDVPADIALQSNGSVHIVGRTSSTALPINSAGGTNMTAIAATTSNFQGFHARFSNGMGLIGSSFLGASLSSDLGDDLPYGIALFGPWNNAIVVGDTQSSSMQVSANGYQTSNPDTSGFVTVLGFYTDPVAVSFSSTSVSDTQSNFVEIELNAPVMNVLGQSVVLTLSPTTAARFSNGTDTITLTIPQGSQRIATKVFSKQVVSPTLVTVSALSSGTTVSGSYTINP